MVDDPWENVVVLGVAGTAVWCTVGLGVAHSQNQTFGDRNAIGIYLVGLVFLVVDLLACARVSFGWARDDGRRPVGAVTLTVVAVAAVVVSAVVLTGNPPCATC